MLKNILIRLTFVALTAIIITGCGLLGEDPAPAPPAVAPTVVTPTPAPVAPVVAAAPPRTDLIPSATTDAAPAPTGTGIRKPGTGNDNIDADIKGPATEGDELLGNYTCTITSSEFPMGLNPPPSGCRIYRNSEGKLRIGPTNRGLGLTGAINNPKAAGFHVNGSYNVGIGKFQVKARMLRKGENNFSGNGRGHLGDNTENKMKYKLTIAK